MTVGDFLMCIDSEERKRNGYDSPDAGLLWTKGEDFGDHEDILLRKNCARILHRYMQKVMGKRDLTEGLTTREQVRDLYDCRICAVHISQILANGIMNTHDINGLKLFEGNLEVHKEEAMIYISRMFE